MTKLDFNKDFQLAFKYITQTRQHVFLTGKAGTGKTTFLKYLKTNCAKNMVVAAPTGVAAINAGGVTLHSLFQLPFAPFIPIQNSGWGALANGGQDKNSLLSKLKYNKNRLSIIRNLELLIIDEISMVRADVLDAIDTILRSVRKKAHIPFGGVQLLMIGDLFQLPPVVQNAEWNILQQYYKSEFFFDSKVMEDCKAICIELTTIYRQNENTFINLLNVVRNNKATDADLELLNKRYQPNIDAKNFITITSHNRQADSINQNNLQSLSTKQFSYTAKINGDFSEYSYPADKELILKEGAQVMFIKNDSGVFRKYFNGKIGKIVRLSTDEIIVKCADDDEEITVPLEVWDNTKYSVDTSNNKVLEEKLGSFTQFPLRLAWAVTIHKSQGLTFEKCAIEAAQSFASGQLYVALSRCTSLDGIYLLNKIPRQALQTNANVVAFYNQINIIEAIQSLPNNQMQYCKELLIDLYDFDVSAKDCLLLQKLCASNPQFFNTDTSNKIDEMYKSIFYLLGIGKKFQEEIDILIADVGITENIKLQQRIQKANAFFIPHLQQLITQIQDNKIQIESLPISKEADENLNDLYVALFTKKYYLESTQQQFTINSFFDCKNNISIPYFKGKTYSANKKVSVPQEVQNPALYLALTDVRNEICLENGIPIYMVANQKTIIEMANYVPLTIKELENITGFGKVKAQKFGDPFIEILQHFAHTENLQSNMEKHPKFLKSVSAKVRKVELEKVAKVKLEHGISATALESFKLFKDGFTIAQIAKTRNFVESTIQVHLASAISVGKLRLIDVMPAEKGLHILDTIKNNNNKSIAELKEILGANYSFGDVRLGLAQHQRNLES